MKKQTKNVGFRPETPQLDLPGTPQKPTVQLIGSLSIPGGASLVDAPTIDVNELLDKPTKTSKKKKETLKKQPFFDEPLFLKANASTSKNEDKKNVEADAMSTQKDFVRKHNLLKSRLSFERIDELTRPQKETDQKIEIELAAESPSSPDFETKTFPERMSQLEFPDWKPLPKFAALDHSPPAFRDHSFDCTKNEEAKTVECPERLENRPTSVSAENQDNIISIPLQTEPKTPAESTDKRIVSMLHETDLNNFSNAQKNEGTIALPLQRTETKLLTVENVHKSYAKGKLKIPVLNGVDFSAYSGEFVSIIGQSGSGKSTLLHLLGTLDNPDSGTIHFEGRRIDNLSIAKRDLLRNHSIGFIFQFYHLLPELTTLENVLSPLMIRESVLGYMTRRRQHIERGKEILDQVGLSHRLKHRPSELSGGEMQRAAIARALVAEPKILLADEPTGNLDSSSAGEIIEILRRLNEEQNLTIIMVTHDNIIAKAADRMVRMVDGVIAEENSTTLEERLLHRIGS